MTSATNAAVATAKKSKKVSHAKPENLELPMPAATGPEFGMMAPDSIRVLDQVRKEFNAEGLRELAEDIAERGILQPLTVRKSDDGFVLVAGERRLQAAKLAKLEAVPVLICEMGIDEHQFAQVAENIQRADLTLAEEADAVRLLHDVLGTVKAVAAKLHKSVAWVSKRLSLAKGLGGYAHGLMADGITEDIELLQCVDKLDRATAGSNSAWALCEAIRAGKAGREEAREALRRATEPKVTAASKPAVKVEADPLWESHGFRHWIHHEFIWHQPLNEEVLITLLGKTADTKYLKTRYKSEAERLGELRDELELLETQHKETLKETRDYVLTLNDDEQLHQAWIKRNNSGEDAK